MQEQMYDDGYHHIVNVDIAEIALGNARMRLKNKGPESSFKYMLLDAGHMNRF